MVRSFICVEINNSEVVSQIEESISKIKFDGVRPVKSNQLHLTLKFLGEVSDAQIGSIKQAIQTIEFPSFNISLEGMGCFPNLNYMRVLWIGIKEGSENLQQLAKIVEGRLNPIGFSREKRRFSPHLTLGRIKKLQNSDKKQLAAIIQNSKTIPIGDQLIDELILKKSTLTPKGAIYENLFVVPLK
ncbi:MAG: RNA 2',3'-cyclic phosphodiesterase [Candidatus Thorarchaeota archaeon]